MPVHTRKGAQYTQKMHCMCRHLNVQNYILKDITVGVISRNRINQLEFLMEMQCLRVRQVLFKRYLVDLQPERF